MFAVRGGGRGERKERRFRRTRGEEGVDDDQRGGEDHVGEDFNRG